MEYYKTIGYFISCCLWSNKWKNTVLNLYLIGLPIWLSKNNLNSWINKIKEVLFTADASNSVDYLPCPFFQDSKSINVFSLVGG